MGELKRVQHAHLAMATQFEIVLYGENELFLFTAAEEVMREIDRWEVQLSYYREDSDVRQINTLAAYQPVSLDPRVFALLKRAKELSAVTDGTFDITVAPLMRCWGFVGASGQMPEEEAIRKAHARVGMNHVHLDEQEYTIEFDQEGMEIDLGAIGKGYAIERAVDLLKEFEIESALLHGGTSAIYALGSPPDADGWKVAIQKPFAQEGEPLAIVELRDTSLSVSAPHGKWFASGGRRYGHVIDPRTGYPTSRNLLAAIIMPSPTDGDALSTGLLTLGLPFLSTLKSYSPESAALVAWEGETGEMETAAEGIIPITG